MKNELNTVSNNHPKAEGWKVNIEMVFMNAKKSQHGHKGHA